MQKYRDRKERFTHDPLIQKNIQQNTYRGHLVGFRKEGYYIVYRSNKKNIYNTLPLTLELQGERLESSSLLYIG